MTTLRAIASSIITAIVIVGSISAQQPPPTRTMGLGGFFLGMSKADIQALLRRSSIQLNAHRFGNDYDFAEEFYPFEFTFGIETPDSASCLGPNIPSASSRRCLYFDSITVRTETAEAGVHAIKWWTTGFSINQAEELRYFTTFILDRFITMLGKPHQVSLNPYYVWANPDEITTSFLKNMSPDVNEYTIATWEWYDYSGRYTLVLAGAYIYFYRQEDGTFVLVVGVYIPLPEEE